MGRREEREGGTAPHRSASACRGQTDRDPGKVDMTARILVKRNDRGNRGRAAKRDLTNCMSPSVNAVVGVSSIGGSRVIQHWNVPDDKNALKKALTAGTVDVLTLAPIWLPILAIVGLITLIRGSRGKTA